MRKTVISNVRLVFPGEKIRNGSLVFEQDRIAAICPEPCPTDAEMVDGAGGWLTPGLIDLHTHGVGRFSYGGVPEDLVAGVACLARYGTTTVFPTLVPRRTPDVLDRLRQAADALDLVRGARAPGLHLEGPFTALPGAGCDVVPGDLGFLQELLDACRGRVSIMSLSPDTPNIIPVIERLCELGIVPFVTHTRADVSQTQAAIEAGARHATHFYDVFPPPPEREPGARPAGVVETFLADERTTVDFIADGCHVDPVVIRMAARAKGAGGVILITDSNIGAGLPPGEYATPMGFPVRVEPGNGARIADPQHELFGALAGSALTMDVGMANLLQWLDLPAEQVWAMGTANPARVARLPHAGRLAVGAWADLVLWNRDLRPVRTWVAGRQVFSAAEDRAAGDTSSFTDERKTGQE